MDENSLRTALANALNESAREILLMQDGKDIPAEGTEKRFETSLCVAINQLQDIGTSNKSKSLAKWGGVNVKVGAQDGKFDILVEDHSDDQLWHYAIELKVVGFPSSTNKSGGYNVIQIAQDTMRLSLLDHRDKNVLSLGGAWVIILGIGDDIEACESEDAILEAMHNSLHHEFNNFLKKTNGCVGNFSNARDLGGCAYLGLNKKFIPDIRPSDCYFAVRADNPRIAALAAWVGW